MSPTGDLCLHRHAFSLGVAGCAPISSPYEDMGPLTDLISLDYPCEDPMSKGHVLRYWELGLYTFFGDTIQPLTVVLGHWGQGEAGAMV